jgi:integrase
MRQFCRYQNQFDPRTYLIQDDILPRRTRPAPYIYSYAQVQKIISAARQTRSPVPLQPELHATLIGLLYATGIRIGEALKLTLQDADFRERVLLIRQTKFGKTRYVPISDSVAKALQFFLKRREQAGHLVAPTAPIFVSRTGHIYPPSQLYTCFMRIMRKLGMRGPKGSRGPRIHDFRHTFAVQRLLAWYRSGVSLQAKLPLLTTYLGHTTVTGTEVYLQATAELLEEANKKFHKNCAIPTRTEAKHVHL